MTRAVRAVIWASLGFWAAILLGYLERRGGYIAPKIGRLHP